MQDPGDAEAGVDRAWIDPERPFELPQCGLVHKGTAAPKQSPAAHDNISRIGVGRPLLLDRRPASRSSSILSDRARRPIIWSCASARLRRSVSNRSAQTWVPADGAGPQPLREPMRFADIARPHAAAEPKDRFVAAADNVFDIRKR